LCLIIPCKIVGGFRFSSWGEIHMIRLSLVTLLFLGAASWLSIAQQAPAKIHQVELNGHTFTLPAGFEIELVAGPPLVNRPITADFDEQGRLYVADSSGSNEPVKKQLEKKPHRIVRLESTKNDGKFDKATVFADKMMFPEGTMWYNSSLYVAAPPSIWKLTDTKGTGVADQRVEWFNGKTLTGCANDLHGPYRGLDGWIYWCKGAFAQQTYDLPGKKLVTRAAHIFRARPDGTGVEPVMTGGMDNPVDVVFTPGGERIFTTTFLQFPAGGLRDGLIHDVYGGVYGKTWDVIYDHPWTGPAVMPVLSHLGPAAPCGLTRYESGVFGTAYHDNLFACLFNMQKVTRHVLSPHGATFKSQDSDFLVSSNKDFHPTDVIEDADGSLLVIDTGGWYKLCCPTSQLVKPDVLGGIYRIKKKDAPRLDDPRGLELGWDRVSLKVLTDRLDNPRPAVRRRAIEALGAGGDEAIAALGKILGDTGKTVMTRVNAVWAATRIKHKHAREIVRSVLNDQNETVCQAAGHSVALWRDEKAVDKLLLLLESPSLPNRRVAAEALGRIGDKSAVPALLEALGHPVDRFLEHSLIYGLIEIADRQGTEAGLKSKNMRTRRTALIALDQMAGSKLEAETVARELASADPDMKETASWIVSRHPEWGNHLAVLLEERLGSTTFTAAERNELAAQLARFAASASIQNLLAQGLNDENAAPDAQTIVLRALAQARLKKVADSWITGLTRVLATSKGDVLRDAVAACRALPIPPKADKLSGALLAIAGDEKRAGVELRLQALAAVPGGLTEVGPTLFAFLTSHLDREQPLATRTLAADVLARARLSSEQLISLAGSFKKIGPMEVSRLLDAFSQSTEDEVGKRLLAGLSKSPARSSLRVEMVKPRLKKFSPAVQKEAEKLYALLDVNAAKQRARLEELLAGLKGGDIRRGQAVFNSPKNACVSCHTIGYLGGKVGPDLTRIGRIRTERDLLEAIVFPSSSFVRGYEPVVIYTKNGTSHNGVIRQDSKSEIVLATGVNQEVRIPRSDIEDMRPSQVSVMPSGLDQQLSPRDLADLVAFLKACR
jgi:putative membrane-bound dehydrogenase-like protein